MVLMPIAKLFKEPRSTVAAFFMIGYWRQHTLKESKELLNNGSFSGSDGTSKRGR